MSDAIQEANALLGRVRAAVADLEAEERKLSERLGKVRDALSALRGGRDMRTDAPPFAVGQVIVASEVFRADAGTRHRVLAIRPHRGHKSGWAVAVESLDEVQWGHSFRGWKSTEKFDAEAGAPGEIESKPSEAPLAAVVAPVVADERLEDARGPRPTYLHRNANGMSPTTIDGVREHLVANGPQTGRQIGAALKLSPGAVSMALTTLSRNNLLRRTKIGRAVMNEALSCTR